MLRRSRDVAPVRSMTRLNRMFPRIVAAQYDVPAHLSADCCDLISRLMTVDIQSRRDRGGVMGAGQVSYRATGILKLLDVSSRAA